MTKQEYPSLGETVSRHTLPNGLDVAVVHRPGFTRKLAYFVTDFGAIHTEFSLDGAPCQVPAGIAHYLEHKMFDLPGRDVMEEFASLGASVNAFTSYDMTAYYFSCTDRFTDNLRLLLEFVSTPYFTEESVQKEQGIIGQEIGMHTDNPDARIFENLMQSTYRQHPIRVPILGTEESIATITPELLYQCHKAFYRPGNMFLCVVGDVDPREVCQIATEVLPESDTVQVTRQEQWQEEMNCPEAQTVSKMEVAMPMFQIGFKCEDPGKGVYAIRSEIIGDLAAEALFGESSPLYLRLYEEGLIDNSFGGGYETISGMALLLISGDSRNPEEVRKAVLEQVNTLLKDGLAPEDFLRMKRSALGRRIKDLDSFDTTAFRLCACHFSGFDYFDFPTLYREVETKDILDFLRRVVTPQRCSMSVIEPRED